MKTSENKPHSIHLRLTDSQYDYCFSNAELMGISVSDFLRMVVNSLAVQSSRLAQMNADNALSLANDMLGDLDHANIKSDK